MLKYTKLHYYMIKIIKYLFVYAKYIYDWNFPKVCKQFLRLGNSVFGNSRNL